MADALNKMIKACNPDASKAGNTLLLLNVLGMAFAALSNTFAAQIDKNTSAEDKKFLVPAGAVTGVANIGVYFLITNKIIDSLKKSAVKIIESTKPEKLEQDALQSTLKFIGKKEKGLLGTGLFKKPADYIDSMKTTLLKDGKPTEAAKNLYKDNVKAGAGVLGAFVGAVVGCAIITPIIRDVSAYFVQKRMEKNNPQLKDKPFRPYFDPSHIGSGRYGRRKQPLSMTNFMAFTNGGMKI